MSPHRRTPAPLAPLLLPLLAALFVLHELPAAAAHPHEGGAAAHNATAEAALPLRERACCKRCGFLRVACNAPVVALVLVVGVFDSCPGRVCVRTGPGADSDKAAAVYYPARVLRPIRGPHPEDNFLFLRTAAAEARCGARLSVGARYVVALRPADLSDGFGRRGVYDVTACEGAYPLWRLTYAQRPFVLKPGKTCYDWRLRVAHPYAW